MSIIGDILRNAAEKQQQLLDEHRLRMRETCDAFNEAIKRPWKTRVEAIGEAVNLVKSITQGDGGKDEPPAA